MTAQNAVVAILSHDETTDPYGDTTEPPGGSETPWPGCKVAPRTAEERLDVTSPGVITGKTVYGPPPPVEIKADDQLRIDGKLYDIEGEPGPWKSPYTGRDFGVEIACKRWERQS